jgi:hypothetical protein
LPSKPYFVAQRCPKLLTASKGIGNNEPEHQAVW